MDHADAMSRVSCSPRSFTRALVKQSLLLWPLWLVTRFLNLGLLATVIPRQHCRLDSGRAWDLRSSGDVVVMCVALVILLCKAVAWLGLAQKQKNKQKQMLYESDVRDC